MGKTKTAIREVAEGQHDDRRLLEALAALQARHDPGADVHDRDVYRRARALLDDADASACSDAVHESIQAYVRKMEDARDEDIFADIEERREFAAHLESRSPLEIPPPSAEEQAYAGKLDEFIELLRTRSLHPHASRARMLLDLAIDQALETRYTDGLSTLVRAATLLDEPVAAAPMQDFEQNQSEIGDHLTEVNRKARNVRGRAENIGLSDATGMAHQFQMAMTLKLKGGAEHPRKAALQSAYGERIEAARASIDGPDIYKTYKDDELATLIDIAGHLGIDDRTLSDMLYIGSRKKKFREVDALIAQLLNWRDFPVRKYPFKFSSEGDYKGFVAFLRQQLVGTAFATAEVRIMGSSLRSRLAGDIDVSIVFDQEAFDAYLRRLREDNRLEAEDEDPGFIKVARRAGFMKVSLPDVVRAVQETYPALKVQGIGLTLLGGPFDLAPALPI